MFKQNIGIMIAVAQLAATQQRFAAVQNEFRLFGMDIVAASVRHAQAQGYGRELVPQHTAMAIALLFEKFITVFLSPRPPDWGCEISDEDAIATLVNDLEEDTVRRLKEINVDFTLPEHLPRLLAEMDAFIEAEIKPSGTRQHAVFRPAPRACPHRLGQRRNPARDWEDLLAEMRRRADKAGWLRYGLPAALGGRDGTNVDMAVIREHLAHKGLGLHNDLQNESSIVGNFPAGDHDGAVRHRRATPRVVGGADHRRTLAGVRAHRAATRLRRDLAGDSTPNPTATAG